MVVMDAGPGGPSQSGGSLLLTPPRRKPILDPGFRPPIVGDAAYNKKVVATPSSQEFHIAIERENGLVARKTLGVLPATPDGSFDLETKRFVERTAKVMAWAYGGHKFHCAGDPRLVAMLNKAYTIGDSRGFDANLMSGVYELPFTVVRHGHPEEMPTPSDNALLLGGNLDGCRIGFDLGASDRKVAAVIDGEVKFSHEIGWDPVEIQDPREHFKLIREVLRLAATHLPRVDAIGGSSAGILVNNCVRVASLFRGVPKDKFDPHVKNIFLELQHEFDDVPFDVINDGLVTALAAGLSMKRTGVLGIAMGSSEAGGFMNREGRIVGTLDELAFAPVDYNLEAAIDPWSKDRGVGGLYFSQQAVVKLLRAAGIKNDEISLPEGRNPTSKEQAEVLKQVQALAEDGDVRALNIAKTIGTYLGYTIPYYREYYDFGTILVLGRVTSGAFGEAMLAEARETFETEFPELAQEIEICTESEENKRVGQAVAAASLPVAA